MICAQFTVGTVVLLALAQGVPASPVATIGAVTAEAAVDVAAAGEAASLVAASTVANVASSLPYHNRLSS